MRRKKITADNELIESEVARFQCAGSAPRVAGRKPGCRESVAGDGLLAGRVLRKRERPTMSFRA
jgi:hypothetical protein